MSWRSFMDDACLNRMHFFESPRHLLGLQQYAVSRLSENLTHRRDGPPAPLLEAGLVEKIDSKKTALHIAQARNEAETRGKYIDLTLKPAG